MIVLYYILAIVLLMTAYYFKICRQAQFIDIYEPAKKDVLFKGLSITFLLNLILPLRLGNIYRIFYVGKRLKNGSSFVLATVIIDIILDVFIVAIIFAFLCGFGLLQSAVIIEYAIMCGVMILCFVLAGCFAFFIKRIILWFCGLFNNSIKLKLLKTSWYSIISFKNIVKRVNKPKLIALSVGAYAMFLLSFVCLSIFFKELNYDITFAGIFNFMYGDLTQPLFLVFYKNSKLMQFVYLLIYFIVPIILIYLFSFLYKNKKQSNKKYLEILPQAKQADRLAFLENYFATKDSQYFKAYIELNQDISVIEDNSAGSNATTILCNKEGKTFWRKYAFGNDANKLKEQIDWLESHAKKLKLTKINNVIQKKGVCSYDMPYVNNSVTCFNYVHTTTIRNSWNIIKNVLDDLDKNLHTLNKKESDEKSLDAYIDKKVIANLEIIKRGEFIKPLLKYDEIYINGKKYKNLTYYEKYLDKNFLKTVFKNDSYADIHGDFTIENIICVKNNDADWYYIIDPNTGNIHNSPYLDYAKLFQSLHGGYEFLMKTQKVSVVENKIDFLSTKSNIYYELFSKVENYLLSKFGREGLKSIFFHEIIHWLRLMPYKIKKNGERSLLFYSGLIMVMADIEEKFKDEIGNF